MMTQTERVDKWPKMNSDAIHERCPEPYKDLFTSCKHVVSCSGTLFYAGEHGVLHGGIAICQHIPLRVYCGIEEVKTKSGRKQKGTLVFSDNLKDHMVYDSRKDKFLEDKFFHDSESNRCKQITDLLMESEVIRNRIEDGVTLRIHTLHELAPGKGANWSGAISTALKASLWVYCGLLDESDVERWKKQPVEQIIYDDKFIKLNMEAWIVETAFHGGKASGYGNFCSLIASPHPLFYATVERSYENQERPIDIKRNYKLLQNIAYGGFRFNEHYQELRNLPMTYTDFDLGLIFSGETKETGDSIVRTHDEVWERLESARDTILALKNEKGLKPILGDNYFERVLSKKDTGEKLRLSYVEALTTKGFEIYQSLYDLLGKGLNEGENLKALACALNDIKGHLDGLSLNRYEVDAVTYHLRKAFKKHKQNLDFIGSKQTGGAHGGSLLFVMPSDTEALVLFPLSCFS